MKLVKYIIKILAAVGCVYAAYVCITVHATDEGVIFEALAAAGFIGLAALCVEDVVKSIKHK